MTHDPLRRALAALMLVAAALALSGLLSTVVLADDGGASGMSGMSQQDMKNMTTPAPAATAASSSSMNGESMPAADSAHKGAAGTAMDPNMDMSKGSINWSVIGGFVVLVVGSTIGAAAMKRRLRRRMASGDLAAAGVLHV